MNTDKRTSPSPTLQMIDTRAPRETDASAVLADAKAALDLLNEQHMALARMVKELELGEALVAQRLARGTETPEVDSPAERAQRIGDRVVEALRSKPKTITEIAAELHLESHHAAATVRRLARTGRLTQPVEGEFFAKVGDVPAQEGLRHAVEVLISKKPMTHQELLEATGARPGRVQGVLVQLQREGAPIVNRGEPRRAQWHLEPVAPKRRKRSE